VMYVIACVYTKLHGKITDRKKKNCVNNYLIWNRVFLPQMCRVLVSCADFKATLTPFSLFEGETTVFNNFTKRLQNGFKIGTRDRYATHFRKENFISNEIVIYTSILRVVIFTWNSLYTKAVAYTRYFELRKPVLQQAQNNTPWLFSDFDRKCVNFLGPDNKFYYLEKKTPSCKPCVRVINNPG